MAYRYKVMLFLEEKPSLASNRNCWYTRTIEADKQLHPFNAMVLSADDSLMGETVKLIYSPFKDIYYLSIRLSVDKEDFVQVQEILKLSGWKLTKEI